MEGRGSRATNYNAAKQASKYVVHQTRSEAEKFAPQKNISSVCRYISSSPANATWQPGEKSVENDACQLALEEEAKKAFWMEHNKHLLNVEFPSNQEDLPGQSKPITFEMIAKVITQIASGKAAGPP